MYRYTDCVYPNESSDSFEHVGHHHSLRGISENNEDDDDLTYRYRHLKDVKVFLEIWINTGAVVV